MSASVRTLTIALALCLAGAVTVPGASAAVSVGRPTGAGSMPHLVASDGATDLGSPALSYTGRYLACVANRRDVVPPRPELRRIDLATGGYELVNRSLDGGADPGRYSMPPVMSGDGSRVAFTSSAARLVAHDTNRRVDAFVRDLSTDRTLLASVAFDGGVANGDAGMMSLSKNGRYAVFTSSATDVVRGSTTTNADVYRRDMARRTTVQVTVRANGTPSTGPGSSSADVSADGNLVAFNSYDTDLAATDSSDHEADLFIRNMRTGHTRWLSRDLPRGADPTGVVLSPDGRWVSTRWADGSLHLTKVATGVTSTVVADGHALLGAFSSRSGRFVFVSAGQPYVHDLQTGLNTALTIPTGGSASTVTISGNGEVAAYDWFPDNGGASRIFQVNL